MFDQVYPDERRLVGLMLAHVVLIGAARGLLYAPAMGLFLARYDAALIPWTYVGVSVVSGLLSAVYLLLTRHLRYSQLLLGTLLVCAGTSGLAWLGLGGPHAAIFDFALPIWFESVFILSELTVWGLASRVFDVQQGKRLFGYLSASSQLGLAAVGLVLPFAIEWLGSATMVLFSALTLLASMVPLVALIRRERARVDGAEDHDEGQPDNAPAPGSERARSGVIRGRFVLAMTAHVVLSVFAYQFVDNIFYVVAEREFTDADAMSSFVALISAVISVTSLVAAVVLTGPILRRLGGPRSLMVRPALVGAIGLAFVVLAPSLAGVVVVLGLATMLRVTNEVVSDALSGPAFNLLYQPLAAGPRARVHAFIDGIVTPISSGAAGLVLVLLVHVLDLREIPLSACLLGLLAACIAADAILRRDYPVMLNRALDSPRRDELEFRGLGSESLDALVGLLGADDPRRVCWAMTTLERAELGRLEPHLPRLLEHAAEEVQLATLELVERQHLARFMALVTTLIDDASPIVRATALGTLSVLRRDNALDLLSARLADPDEHAAVLVEAAGGLLRYGGPSGELQVRARLEQLGSSPAPSERVMLARIIGEARLQRLHPILIPLLADSEGQVRTAAALAAARVPDPALLIPLASCLDDPIRDVRQASAATLAGWGGGLAPFVEAALSNWREQPPARLRGLIRAAGRGRDPLVARGLEHELEHEDAEIQAEVVAALAHMRHHLALDHPSLAAILRELAGATQRVLLARIELDALDASAMLCAALEHELRRLESRALRVLALGYPRAAMDKVAFNVEWGDKYERSLALESLTVMLDPTHLALALPLVEADRPPEVRLAELDAVLEPSPRASPTDRLVEIATGARPWTHSWLRACAIQACGTLRIEAARGTLESARTSAEPIIRESATAALACLQDAPDQAKRMLTIEKVAILKTAEVFASSPDYVLAAVASVAEEVLIPAGETFIEEGELEDGLYLLVEGQLEVEVQGKAVAQLGPGEVVGEMHVLDPAPRAASVRTTSDSLLFRIRREPLMDLLLDRPEITLSIARVIVRRLKQSQAG